MKYHLVCFPDFDKWHSNVLSDFGFDTLRQWTCYDFSGQQGFFFFPLSLFSAVTLFFLITIPCVTLPFSPSSLVYYTFQKHVWDVEHFSALPGRLLLVSYFSGDETESQKGNWIIKKPLIEPPVPGSLSHALLSMGPCFLLQLLSSARYTD